MACAMVPSSKLAELHRPELRTEYHYNVERTPNNGAGGNNASSPSGSSSASTLYVRREAVYLGSDQVGILRVGQDDGPFSQFDNGVTTFQFGTGAWNGDALDNLIGAVGIVVFPFVWSVSWR